MKKKFVFLFFISIIVFYLFGQEKKEVQIQDESKTDEKILELPTGFRKIVLGNGFEDVKKKLKEDSVFGYRGERDVSLLADKNMSLIETSGSSNIKRSWFQFYDNKLYIITIQLDTDKVDYYSVYTALSKKYGEPLSIDPKKAVWKGESVSMIVERPLVIKYIDLNVFNEILEKTQTEKAYSEILREDFINEF